MVLPLDDILKAISRGGGAGAQIARGALRPTQISGTSRFLSPTASMGNRMPVGRLAGKGLLAGYTPPQTSQHERREGPGGLFGAALTAIDLGRGIVTSTIKESIDLMQGEGFDPGEWWNQATTQYGFGELIHDERNWVGGMLMVSSPFTGGVGLALGAGVLADNIWADRVIGFIGDVAVDPLMYMGGLGAFARGAGWAGAVKQLNDIAKVRKLSPAAKAAVGRAKGAAGQKKSLSAAVRSLRKEGDVGKELIKDLGWSPGARIRLPMSGPFGRQMRKVGGVGDRVWDAASRARGKPSWVTGRRVKQIPDMYRDMFDKRTLTEMVDAFGRGRKAMRPVMEAAERELGPEMAAKLARVAGQAAKAPLEIALPGFTRLGPAAGAAGLGGRFISQAADLPIRGTQKVVPEKFRTKVATLFDPQASLRVELASGNPKRVARAVGISDSQRFAAGRAKIAERGINSANQKVLNFIRFRGASDTSMTALVRAIRGIDDRSGRTFAVRNDVPTVGGPSRRFGEIIDVDTSTNWFKNLPEDLQQLYRTSRERFVAMARAADQQLDEVERHTFLAYGDNFGDDVLKKEGARYSGHRQVNREFLKAILGEDPPKRQGRRGYPVRRTIGITGRPEPSSVKERGYRVGGPLKIEDPDLLPPVVEGRVGYVAGVNKDGSPLLTADKRPIMVLADEVGNPFKFQNPNKVGMSFDAQVNRVTQQTFGMNLYDDRFSMLAHMQMRNVETDIKMYAFMRKLEEDGTITVAGPDEVALLDDIIAATASWDEMLEQKVGLGASRARLEERVARHRSNETVAASHRANRDADVGRLSDEGVAAYDELAEVDVAIGELRANLLVMEEELGLLGARSAEVGDLQAKTRVLIERTDKVSRQKKIRGEMLSERDSIIAEVDGHIRQLDDLMKLLDELTELRPQLEAAIRADIGGTPGGVARLQSDLVAAREASARVEATYAAKKAEYDAAEQTYTTAVADFKRGVSEAGEARPQAARAEVKAQQLEAEAGRTAIPDIGDDPWVVAARDELADAEVALQVVEREQQQLLQRIAAIEALPGFVEEGSKAYNAARLATAPLFIERGGLSVKNPLVHTKNGAVRRGALRARQQMLTERLDRAVDELDEAVTRGMDDALEADLERTIPNRPNTPEVRARTAEIKRLRGEIADVQRERALLTAEPAAAPAPTGRAGNAAQRHVQREIEARRAERAAGWGRRGERQAGAVDPIELRGETVAPPEGPAFQPRPTPSAGRAVTPAPERTLRQANADLRDLRKDLRGLLFADAADRRAQSVLQGRRWDGLKYKAADKKKIRAKREKVSKARKTLETEQGKAAEPLTDAQGVVEAHTRRDIAREAKDALEREVAVVKKSEAGISGRAKGVEAGRLPVAQERRAVAAQAVAEQEDRALRTGGTVEIVGATDPRVRNPRLYAQGPEGQGLVRIARDPDELVEDYALLRAERVQRAGAEDAWKFTHLDQDLTRAPGGRNTALIRAARPESPKRAEMRQRGWRFFDEDVAEGSTRISGEAAEARQAAGATSRRAYEAERSAAEATKRMTPVGPKPEVPSTTYESSAALREAFEEQVTNIRQQVGFVREQLKIVNASLYRFAEDDVTSDAMVQIKEFLEALNRGVAGAEGTTASARVNRYMDNLNELTRLMRSVEFERTLGVEELPDMTRRLAMFNKRIAEIGTELGVDTRLEDIVAGLPGMQQRVPRLSPEQLQGLRNQYEVLEDLQQRANVLMGEASQRGEDYAKAARMGREYGRREAKNQAQVAALEAGALVRQLEKETALFNDMRMAMRTRRELTKRISATTERLDREGTFVVSPKSDKDVRRLALDVEGARAKQGVEGRGAWTEPGAKDQRVVRERSLKEVLDIAHSIEPRGGYDPASVEGKLFALNQKERDLAQRYLKESLSKNEWGPWTLSKGDPWLPEMQGVIRAFSNVNDPSKWDGTEGLWKVWDNFQTYLKAAMIATPGFVNRNIFGAFFNAWLDDVNPMEIMRSAKMTLNVAKRAREDGVGFYSAAKQLAKTNPEYRQYVDLLDVGVRGGGQAVHSVELEIGLRNAMDLSLLVGGRGRAPATTVSLAPWSPRFAWFQGIRSLNSWVEDIVRLGVGMDTMRWGGNVDDALRRIAKTQFDYDELTQFERKWMRRFFPFYTWTRKNVPYQLDQLARNPAKFNKILAGKRNLEMGTEEEDIVPDYFLEPFGVRTPFKYKGATVYSAPDFPFQDLARYDPFDREGGGLKEGAQNVMSMLTPILKAPLESAFGKQMYNGVPFTGRFQLAPAAISKFPGMSQALQGIGWIKKSPNGEWKMRDHHIYLVTNMLPTLGFLRRIAPNEPKYQRAYLRTLMSTLGGVSASFNTDQAKHNWLTNLRYERQEERQEWKDMTSQTR